MQDKYMLQGMAEFLRRKEKSRQKSQMDKEKESKYSIMTQKSTSY